MAYVKTNWENEPSKQTPISAENLNHMEDGIYNAQQAADTAQAGVDSLNTRSFAPIPVELVADMTDETKNYLYLGSETGYESGYLYYWDGTAWTKGNEYQTGQVVTDPTLEQQGKAADAKATGDAIGNLSNALTAKDFTINSTEHLVNYGYNTAYNLPSSGGTGASAIGVKSSFNHYVINTTGTQSSDVKMKINDGIVRTNDNTVVDEWTGITLKENHIYKVKNVKLSGISDADSPLAISVYKEGTHATIGTSSLVNDVYERTFVYDGTPVVLSWFFQSGKIYTDFESIVMLEDVSENVEVNISENSAKCNNANNLVKYFGTDGFLPYAASPESAAAKLEVIRHNTSVILNHGGGTYLSFVKLNGSIAKTSTATVADDWEGITLKTGSVYRISLKLVNGTVGSGDSGVSVSVYPQGTHSTIGTGGWNGKDFYRIFTCPNSPINVVLYVPAGMTFENAEYSVIMEELFVEQYGIGASIIYAGESMNVDHKMWHEKYMTLSAETNNSVQGSTVHGDYLFVAYNKLPMISVYDFNTRALVNNIEFTPVDTYHCNNVNFGSEKYDADDDFPLLYVSMENEDEHKCLVFRVTVSDNVFSASLVQTITYPTPSSMDMYYPNCFIDPINNFMYLVGYSHSEPQVNNWYQRRFMGFKLPTLAQGDVTLNANDAFQNFVCAGFPTSQQGGFIMGDKMIIAFGNPSHKPEIYIGQFSLSGERCVSSAVLNDLGITTEPESVFAYNGDLYVCLVNKEIQKLYCN